MRDEISGSTKLLMYAFAVSIDSFQNLINWIPIIGVVLGFLINPLISLVALSIFWRWFSAHDVSIFQGKIMSVTARTIVLETFPIVESIAPGWTFFVYSALKAAKQSESAV